MDRRKYFLRSTLLTIKIILTVVNQLDKVIETIYLYTDRLGNIYLICSELKTYLTDHIEQ